MDHINFSGKNIIKISLKYNKQIYYQRENGVNMFAVLFFNSSSSTLSKIHNI